MTHSQIHRFLVLVLSLSASVALAQSAVQTSPVQTSDAPAATNTQRQAKPAKKAKKQEVHYKPFSQIGIAAGFSLMGINLQAATNLNDHMNLRGIGNVFNYTVSNIDTNGFNIDAKLDMATAGVSLDLYPFRTHGLRVSPGVLFLNHNQLSGDVTVQGGTSFELNDTTYYSSSSNPVAGTAHVGLNNQNPAFTLTTGWGNMISRKGSRISFPFELGVAFTGAPVIHAALTQGQVCDVDGSNCVNVATDTAVQSNLQAELAKYRKDVDPYKVYPIFSFGISYRFGIR